MNKCFCDRCRKEMIYGKFPYGKATTVKGLFILGFGAYDYSEIKYDLCQSCTKDFDKFMKKGRETE